MMALYVLSEGLFVLYSVVMEVSIVCFLASGAVIASIDDCVGGPLRTSYRQQDVADPGDLLA